MDRSYAIGRLGAPIGGLLNGESRRTLEDSPALPRPNGMDRGSKDLTSCEASQFVRCLTALPVLETKVAEVRRLRARVRPGSGREGRQRLVGPVPTNYRPNEKRKVLR